MIILVLAIETQLNGQTISIKTKLFDFFALEAVSAKGLRKDTAILNQIIKKKDSVNSVLNENISLFKIKHVIDSTSKVSFKNQAEKCSEKLEKKEKNNKRLIKVVLGIASVAILEGFTIYILVRN